MVLAVTDLRWYQDEAAESPFVYWQHNKGNPIIALPTASGKSLVLAEFARRCYQRFPYASRILALTHVKELIQQDYDALMWLWPGAPAGKYSAGLGERDTQSHIIFGGCKSVVNNVEQFGFVDLVGIDECHLVSPEENTTYMEIINRLRAINPYLKVFGLTATKYRMGQGLLTDGGLFTDICYDMTTPDGFMRLVAEGYLCLPIPKRTRTELDVSKVDTYKGDFAQGQLEQAINTEKVNYAIVQEACELGQDRQAWMAFCSGIDHANDMAAVFESFGIPAAAVHSRLKPKERDARIEAYKRGELRVLTNNNVLTTGFDHPPMDFIIMARPTLSTVLWVQMIGRGTRISPATGKKNCLVADFARNTARLGPINDPRIPRKKGEEGGDMPVKICEACGTYNHARVRFCINCGDEFSFSLKLTGKASELDLVKGPETEVGYFNVTTTIYNLHQKIDKRSGVKIAPDSIRVSYVCGLQRFDEWVTLEQDGWAGKRSRDWWRQRHSQEPPATTSEGLQRAMRGELRQPRQIRVWMNHKPQPQVMSYVF